jgi:alpha-mannosidase
MLSPAARGFSVMPNRPVALRFEVTVPAAARPGAAWWGLVKVMYYGRVRYSGAMPVTITPA